MRAKPHIRRLIEALLRPFAAVEAPQTYALLRIGLGALVIANVWTLWPHLDYLYSDLGIAPAAQVCGKGMAQLSLLCHLPAWGPEAVIMLFTAVALAFTVGLATRVSGVLTVILYASLWWRGSVSAAGEHVFADLLFILCLARCGEAYSLDRWFRRRRGEPTAYTPVPSWPRYLLILQLALILGVNGWVKSGAAWRDGEALFYVLANDRFPRFPPWALLDALGPTLTRAMSWSAWLIERGFAVVVLGLLIRPWLRRRGAPPFVRRLADWALGRRVWATGAALLMLGITVLMDIPSFALASAVAVLCLFRGDELAPLLPRLGSRGPDLAPAPPTSPGPRPWLIVAGAFTLWHGWVITTSALVPLTGEIVPAPIADVMKTYQRYTHNVQFWRMFSPSVAKVGHYLRVLVNTGDGQTHDAPSDLDLDHGRRLKLGYDRRTKIYSTLIDPKNEKLRRAHAGWVCNTWRSPTGARPLEVVILRIEERLPSPTWPLVPEAREPREVELTRAACDAP